MNIIQKCSFLMSIVIFSCIFQSYYVIGKEVNASIASKNNTDVEQENEIYTYSNYQNGKCDKIMVSNDKKKLVYRDSGEEFNIIGIGIGDCFKEEFDTARTSYSSLKQLKKDGFNTIRYMFNASKFYNFKSGKWDEADLEQLKMMCERAEKCGLYVIIDMHVLTNSLHFMEKDSYVMLNSKQDVYFQEYLLVWQRIAGKLKDNNNVLAYSLMNEPAAMINSLDEVNIVEKKYIFLMETTADIIREIDPETIISVQNINCFVDSNYVWQNISSDIEFLDNLKIDNLLIDMRHWYPNCILSGNKTGFNRILSIYAGKGERKYINSKEKYTYEDIKQNKKLSVMISNSEGKYYQIDQIYETIYNGLGSCALIDEARVYIIDKETKKEQMIICLNGNTSNDILKAYQIGDVFGKEYEVDTNSFNIYLSNQSNKTLLPVVITPSEALRVEIDVKHDTLKKEMNNLRACLTIRYCEIKASVDKNVLVGIEEYCKEIVEYDIETAKRLGTPIYYGEYCINAKYINDLYNYKDYAKSFSDLCQQYNINRVWHRMTEYPVDNGYGCYIGSTIVREENKRSTMWEYIMPQFLKNE